MIIVIHGRVFSNCKFHHASVISLRFIASCSSVWLSIQRFHSWVCMLLKITAFFYSSQIERQSWDEWSLVTTSLFDSYVQYSVKKVLSVRADLVIIYGFLIFLSDPGTIYGSRCLSVCPRRFANWTDITLADEDTKLKLTDKVTPPGGQTWNQFKWCHLMTKF